MNYEAVITKLQVEQILYFGNNSFYFIFTLIQSEILQNQNLNKHEYQA